MCAKYRNPGLNHEYSKEKFSLTKIACTCTIWYHNLFYSLYFAPASLLTPFMCQNLEDAEHERAVDLLKGAQGQSHQLHVHVP